MQQTENELKDVVSLASKIQQNSLVSGGLKAKIQEESVSLGQNWNELQRAIEERAKR